VEEGRRAPMKKAKAYFMGTGGWGQQTIRVATAPKAE